MKVRTDGASGCGASVATAVAGASLRYAQGRLCPGKIAPGAMALPSIKPVRRPLLGGSGTLPPQRAGRPRYQYSLLTILSVCWWCTPAVAQRQGPLHCRFTIADCRLPTAVGSNRESVIANQASGQAVGRQDFESRCSRCHGLDGRGGEHGPNISTSQTVQQLTDEEVFRIVRDGVPAQGMPAFDFLAASEIRSIVSYLRSLGQQSSQQPLRGDPARGQELFWGKARCGSCHMIDGRGGFLGSDLTGYGRTHGPDDVRKAILDTARLHDPRRVLLEVVTRRDEHFSGVVRNEDNFSLQLLGADGVVHMLMKSEVEHSKWSPSPAMPEDYGKQLSASELDDLVSYLARKTVTSDK